MDEVDFVETHSTRLVLQTVVERWQPAASSDMSRYTSFTQQLRTNIDNDNAYLLLTVWVGSRFQFTFVLLCSAPH